MSEKTPPNAHARIDATEVSWVEVTDDGRRLCLRLRDEAGQPASVSLPVASLNAVLTGVLRADRDLLAGGQADIHTLDGWSLGRAAQGLLLTLHLPDGAKITFAVKPWQIAAIASLAGSDTSPRPARLN